MIIMIQVDLRNLRSYFVTYRKNRPCTGDYIFTKSENNKNERAERLLITGYTVVNDTFTAELAPKSNKVGFTARTELGEGVVWLKDPRNEYETSFELYHSDNRVVFDCYQDHPVDEEKDEVDQVLNAELDRLQEQLYGHIVDERELLRRSMELLRKPSRAKRLALALEIQHHLARLP